MKLKHNASEVDRSKDGDFTPPKPGVYPMKVESATYEKDKDRIVFVTRMNDNDGDGNGKGYGFWDYVPTSLDWKVDQWLQAIGIETEDKDEVEYDVPKDFVGKTIMGRVKSDFYTPDGADEAQYKPKLARALPWTEEDSDDEFDESELEDESVEEEAEEVAEDADTPSAEEVSELGELADGEDEDSIVTLNTLGLAAGLNPDDYPTWGELAEAIVETMVPAKKPAEKAAAKKAAAKAKPKPEPEEDADEGGEDDEDGEDGEDYESWELADLKAEAESRELSAKGSKTAIIARLRTADDDPFAD